MKEEKQKKGELKEIKVMDCFLTVCVCVVAVVSVRDGVTMVVKRHAHFAFIYIIVLHVVCVIIVVVAVLLYRKDFKKNIVGLKYKINKRTCCCL